MKRYKLPKKALFKNFELKLNKKYCKKVSFATQADADYYIDKLQKTSTRDKIPVNSYLCPKCNCWHLTSWEQIDLNKFVSDTNKELKEVFEEYDEAVTDMVKVTDTILIELENALIERNNAYLESKKLKKELDKLNLMMRYGK